MNKLGEYEDLIYSDIYDESGCGLDFSAYNKTFSSTARLNLKDKQYLDIESFVQDIDPVIEFVRKLFPMYSTSRPFWAKVNIGDQAFNELIGIGYLNMEEGWLMFILNYLQTDKALEGGDTIFAIFGLDFTWCVCFTLSQDENILIVEKYDKKNVA